MDTALADMLPHTQTDRHTNEPILQLSEQESACTFRRLAFVRGAVCRHLWSPLGSACRVVSTTEDLTTFSLSDVASYKLAAAYCRALRPVVNHLVTINMFSYQHVQITLFGPSRSYLHHYIYMSTTDRSSGQHVLS